MKNYTVRDLAQIALVAALYVALTITPPLNAIGSNEIQFRVSEMLNFMAFYKLWDCRRGRWWRIYFGLRHTWSISL